MGWAKEKKGEEGANIENIILSCDKDWSQKCIWTAKALPNKFSLNIATNNIDAITMLAEFIWNADFRRCFDLTNAKYVSHLGLRHIQCLRWDCARSTHAIPAEWIYDMCNVCEWGIYVREYRHMSLSSNMPFKAVNHGSKDQTVIARPWWRLCSHLWFVCTLNLAKSDAIIFN